ncbi:MAG: Swt1 family HEPN domain-containing protein, partial [Acidimicrobiales bacterium]
MALSNRDRIGKAVELLGEGLMAFVDSEMTAHAPAGAEWLPALAAAGPNPNRKVSLADPQFQLKVLWDYWNPVFSRLLGRTERTMVSLLRDARDRWAHNESFSYDEAYRCLDAAQFLLQAVSAGAQAEEVRRAKDELQRSHYEEATRKAARTQGPVGAPTGGLPAWREVVVPHADVAAGTFAQAEFAADLAQVARGEGAPEYSDPVEFFRRTFLTEGLRQLLAQALGRLGGDAGVPVVDLQTNFGGGKTHSLLALYHLFSGVALARLPQEVQDLAHGVGLAELPAVRMAVLVGTAIAPGQPVTKPDGTVERTLWGELAWQLGGPDGNGMVAESDAMGTRPGAALCTLFANFGPALVLIDEWVAYARQLYGREDLPAGSFDAHFSFAQALTEAARATKTTLVVVSIPASDPSRGEAGAGIEVGGSGGREALARLRNVVGRMESAWHPASATESFEIVRRRLFEPITDPDRFAARDAVARAFGEFYRSESSQFPTECREGAYIARMRDAYPIHPELFARLYEDWSALE